MKLFKKFFKKSDDTIQIYDDDDDDEIPLIINLLLGVDTRPLIRQKNIDNRLKKIGDILK